MSLLLRNYEHLTLNLIYTNTIFQKKKPNHTLLRSASIMAAAIVGGAFLSGFINVVFDRLLSPEAVKLIKGKKLDRELVERLETALLAAEALLVDAEKKQFGNETVRKWLDDLKDAVYKADDLLDGVITVGATRKEEVSTLSLKVRQCFQCFFNFQDREMVSKMEEVARRIEYLEKRRYILGLERSSRGNDNLSWRIPSTALVKENIYGREGDQEALIKKLNENSEDQLFVMPIVGMGGVGKTTLAQWLYNNEAFMKGFDLKAWVCVSEDFDVVEITRSVIGGITSSICNLNDFNLLQLELKEKLSQKKFFVVLDDVWSEDGDKWNIFKTPFHYGAKGSKIIVTTRTKEVASVVQTCSPYPLKELSDDYCWSVFADNACFSESNENSVLEEIGRKIVKKCKGLPLAAETLGRLLRTKQDVQDWNNVLMSDVWEFPLKDSKIIPALLISYYHLPAYLKRCFVYCSLFPKDYQFDKDELILLWMAEDLLRPPKGGESLEEVGRDCFGGLASRLFFKQFRDDNESLFVMHDLLHDLATFLAGDFYCRLEELGKTVKMKIQTRHLSYGGLSGPISKCFDSIDKVESLRTFLPLNLSGHSLSFGSETCVLISKLKYSRVLSFPILDVLPNSIGELIHLRYLNISYTYIKTLPESLCELYNLQTLKLRGCEELTSLPSGMCNLVNLRHLDIMETSLKEMPGGMSKLNHLQFLSNFVVGKRKDNGIKELGGLSNLHGSLEIMKLENVANSDEAMGARIMDMMHLDNLVLKWSSSGEMVGNTETERDILDKLRPHVGLKELTIHGYMGTRFPNWVGHSSYQNMTRVSLYSCNGCFKLPSLGQVPFLKHLRIEDFKEMKSIGEEFYKSEGDHSATAKPFPSLVELSFHNLPCWKVWGSFGSNAFPLLLSLQISNCPRLTGDLPNHLTALRDLYINKSFGLLTSFPLDVFPNLKNLSIEGCKNLESLSSSHSEYTALDEFLISDCPNFVSFPKEGLHAPNMTSFRVYKCKMLKSLPCHMNTLVPSLEDLQILECPEIESFPEGGLPPNLKLLRVVSCEKLLNAGMSSLGILEALTVLAIARGFESVKSFPKEGFLPHLPSLTTLYLHEFSSVETLECKELLRLTSLQRLEIDGCPKLQNMVGQTLPSSLSQLEIYYCPLLGECIKTKDPHIWPIISHIPTILVDRQQVS